MHRIGHYGALICYVPLVVVLIVVGTLEMAFAGGVSSLVGQCFQISTSACPAFPIAARHTVWFALAVGTVLDTAGTLVGGPELGAVGAIAGALLIVPYLLADVLTLMRMRNANRINPFYGPST
ncbi:membrane-bound metal-dependent hydrolase [Haloarcula japonica DSM 6131]|uniref:Uncharacterized protein n=2 Tax=Haloarcula TaxID=2237 RepID=A0A830F3T4_9EURY|nr:membrane-bound metal-dependent hydrolase [Haloarcula japonica DSM 6131]GGK79866.1 hypothetical protein GCM10009067_35270 [Haloarcula sebkhae]